MIKNIAETVYNKLEEEIFLERLENTDLSNLAEHLNIDEPDLTLDILNIINFRSPIFYSNEIHLNENKKSDDESSNKNDEGYKYDVNNIITSMEECNVHE